MNRKITFIILGIVILATSGCMQSTKEKEQLSPVPTPVPTVETTTVATATPTPLVTPAEKQLPPNYIYVIARMVRPVYWGDKGYELRSLKVEIYNQVNTNLQINAQIISGGQVLEERSFALEGEGNNYQFSNSRQHYINNTNVTLRLQVTGYQPVEYKVAEVINLG